MPVLQDGEVSKEQEETAVWKHVAASECPDTTHSTQARAVSDAFAGTQRVLSSGTKVSRRARNQDLGTMGQQGSGKQSSGAAAPGPTGQ